MTRTEEIVAELKMGTDEETEKQAWVDFIKKYHFAVVKQRNPQGENIIPNALYLDTATMDFDYSQEGLESGQLDGTEHTDPEKLPDVLDLIGLKTIDDMPRLEQGFYVDTPKNRKICADALKAHPDRYGVMVNPAEKQTTYTYHLKVRLCATEDGYCVSKEEQDACHGNAFLAASQIVEDVIHGADYGELKNVFASEFRMEEPTWRMSPDSFSLAFDVNGYAERDVTLTEPLRQDMLHDTSGGWGYGVEEYGLSPENEQALKNALKDIDFGKDENTFNDILQSHAEPFADSPYPFYTRIVGAELVRERKQEAASSREQMADAKETFKQAVKAFHDACRQNGIDLSSANKNMLTLMREVSDKEKGLGR